MNIPYAPCLGRAAHRMVVGAALSIIDAYILLHITQQAMATTTDTF